MCCRDHVQTMCAESAASQFGFSIRASRFVDKLLSRITSENATLPIPVPRL